MSSSPSSSSDNDLLVVENWPMNLDTTRQELEKARKRLEQYRAALRLAGVEIERRNKGLIALTTFVYQASRAGSASALLKLALVQALETVKSDTGAIVLIHPESKNLTLGVHKGLTPTLHDILTGRQLNLGATALMPHLVAGSGALLETHSSPDRAERMLLTASHLTGLVSLPLHIGARLVGTLLVGIQQDKRTFLPTELCFLMALGQATAIALENLRLREGLWHTAEALLGEHETNIDLSAETKTELSLDAADTPFSLPPVSAQLPEPAEDDMEHLLAAMMEAEEEVQQQNADLQTLNIIAEQMNRTLNLKEILHCAVEQTKNTLHTDVAWLYLLDEERNRLEMRAQVGLSRAYMQAMHHLNVGSGIEGEVTAANKPIFIESVAADSHNHKIWVDKEGLHGVAAVPITRPDVQTGSEAASSHVVGVLVTGTTTQGAHAWSPREIRLLTSIANQVALAIDNAHLYARLREDEMGLRAGNEVLRTINDMLLEKNVFLEGFIQDDLAPALTEAAPLLEGLLAQSEGALTPKQQETLTRLHQALGRLGNLAGEASYVSEVLDDELDKKLADKKPQDDLTAAARPPRLKKSGPAPRPVAQSPPAPEPTRPDPVQHPPPDQPPQPTTTPEEFIPPQALSFAEAVAAGLVPNHILEREQD